ncbi:transmembrane protein 243 isoform X3 [Mauremys reevesii]|uniref:transmembrane protein 243 isoform X3 n=1 Tax=Mauremys reevesii TaxID=260615 RepID=UPI00193F6A85|nr:transmembrane protein 243 isoform X3 [Mauremys reevesii]
MNGVRKGAAASDHEEESEGLEGRLGSLALSHVLCVALKARRDDRIINLAVGSLTSLLLIVTLISAFIFPQLPPKPVNIFFAFCISLCSVSAGILATFC